MRCRPTTAKMLVTEAPKFSNGDIALCHGCQRWVQIDGGVEKYLTRRIKLESYRAVRRKSEQAIPTCLSCGCTSLYIIKDRLARRCSQCHSDVPMAAAPSAKLPAEMYAKARQVFADDPVQSVTAFSAALGVTYKTAWTWINALRGGTFGRAGE